LGVKNKLIWQNAMTTTSICRSLRAGLVLFFAATLGPTFAADGAIRLEAGDVLAVAISIDSENLIELYQSVPDLIIIDSRHYEDHRQGYIETSYNLPLASTDCGTLDKLADTKEQAMVFYCNGDAADASMAAIRIASVCGYQRLFWFRGGFVEWEDKDYPYVIK